MTAGSCSLRAPGLSAESQGFWPSLSQPTLVVPAQPQGCPTFGRHPNVELQFPCSLAELTSQGLRSRCPGDSD